MLFGLQALHSQVVLYQENFGQAAQAPGLPSRWSSNSAQVMTDPNTPSGGYPGASGGNNLMARNCLPEWEERIFEVAGISTIGYTGIRVGFGHRRTACFVPPVSLEWSHDAIHWEALEDYLVPAQAGVWSWAGYFELPETADNREEIFLRWQYWTEYLAGCSFHCNAFTGNYRIDDVVIEASVPLPVEWLNFDARVVESRVLLEWATASEIGNDYFEVHRSADGQSYTFIGKMPGHGYSQVRNDYLFTDPRLMPGTYYYRLRQVDFDGKYNYSPIRAVHVASPFHGDWEALYEPGMMGVYLNGPPGRTSMARVTCFDTQGRPLWQSIIPPEQERIQLTLPYSSAGIHFIHVWYEGYSQTIPWVNVEPGN